MALAASAILIGAAVWQVGRNRPDGTSITSARSSENSFPQGEPTAGVKPTDAAIAPHGDDSASDIAHLAAGPAGNEIPTGEHRNDDRIDDPPAAIRAMLVPARPVVERPADSNPAVPPVEPAVPSLPAADSPLARELRDALMEAGRAHDMANGPASGEPSASDDPAEQLTDTQQAPAIAEIDDFRRPLPARLKSASSIERLNYEQDLRAMISFGLKTSAAASLEKAQKRFDAGRQRCSDDPRLYYAYGLVQLEHGQFKAAGDQFLAAGRAGDPPFLPGWQAAAWARVNGNDRSGAWSILGELTGRVGRGTTTAADARGRCAEWIGRAAGFLAEPEVESGAARPFDLTALGERLPEGLRPDFDRGSRSTHEKLALLRRQAARPADDLERDTQAFLAALTAEKGAADERARELADDFLQSDQIVKLAADNLLMATQRRTLLKREYGYTRQSIAALSQPQTYREKITVSVPDPKRKGDDKEEVRTVERPENDAEREQRLAQLRQAQERVKELTEQLAAAEMAQAEAHRHEEEARKTVKPTLPAKRQAANAARRHLALVTAQVRDLKADPPTPASLLARSRSLGTVVPLVPRVEIDRLLQSLRPAATK